MSTVKISGIDYEVAHFFSDVRALVKYEGLFVLADKVESTDDWELSGETARPEEKHIIAELTAPMEDQSIVTIVKGEEGS